MDKVEHDIMNYHELSKPRSVLSAEAHEVLIIHDIMGKPNSMTILLYIFHIIHPQKQKRTFSHFVSEENTPRGLVTRQTLNLT